MANVERLEQLAVWLTGEERARRLGLPSHWDQSVWVQTRTDDGLTIEAVQVGDKIVVEGWSCGTAACAAGHIALEDGGQPAFYYATPGDGHQHHPVPPRDGHDDPWYRVVGTLSDAYMWFGDGLELIEDHATRVLDLDSSRAGELFDGRNDYRRMVTAICDILDEVDPAASNRVLHLGDDLPDEPDEPDDEDGQVDW
jgi:hypothetical protein